MAGPKYIKFYPVEYLADTTHLTLEEHGAYLKLILHYYQTEKPIELARVAKIIGASKEIAGEILREVQPFFTVSDGYLVHEKIEREIAHSNSKSEKARASANTRWNDANAKQSQSDSMKKKDSEKVALHDLPKTKTCPHQEIIALYHKFLPDMAQVRTWEGDRPKHLKARWANYDNLEWWEWFFKVIHTMDFYNGREGSWKADLAWIVRPTNFQKLVDKAYEIAEGNTKGARK